MAAHNNIIPNDGEPTRPFIIVQFTNAIKLIPTNYITWKAQIKSTLVGYGLFKFLDGTHLAPAKTITTNNVAAPNQAYATWMRQDQLLYGALVGTLASTVAPLITQAETSHEAWKILEDTYANPSRGHTNLLKEKLKTMTKGTQSVSEFMQQVKGCADLLASLGKKQDPEDIIDFVLKGLDSSFQSVIDGVHARDTTIKFEELHEKLINKELQNKLAAPPSHAPASAMTMQTKPNKNKQKAPYPTSNWSLPPPPSSAWQSPPPYQSAPPQPRPFKPFQGRCQWCRETGHVVGFCPLFRQTAPHLRPPPQVRPPYNPSPQPQAQNNMIQPSTQPWLVDSGASHHVRNDLQNLSLHYPYAGPDELIVGNGKGLKISKVGKLELSSATKTFNCDNVLFVPNISKNIISVSKFASQNQVSIQFLPNCFLVKDLQTGTVLLKGPCVDGVYSWPLSRSPQVFVTQVSDGSSWHHKLGHPSPPILKFLQSSFQLGISHSKSDFCNSCSINKSHKLPFQKSTISSTYPLEVIYSDLWTSPVLSHDGYRYYVIFVDHFTKYIWFYPLKHKSDTNLTFIKFKALVENYFKNKIKIFY